MTVAPLRLQMRPPGKTARHPKITISTKMCTLVMHLNLPLT